MYVSVSRLRVEPDRAAQLVEAFRSRAHLVDAFDGFEQVEVWQSSTAERVCATYYAEFPDTDERYGARGRAYCAHDTAYLAAWVLQAIELGSPATLERNVRWLADLLGARGFPVDRYARNLELVAAAIVEGGLAPANAVQEIMAPMINGLADPSA